VANDKSSFTSTETDHTSNVTQVARKQCVDCHRMIHAEQSSSFEPILRQNFRDGDKVRFDPPHMRWS
jgi:deoxycytidylate deaminase